MATVMEMATAAKGLRVVLNGKPIQFSCIQECFHVSHLVLRSLITVLVRVSLAPGDDQVVDRNFLLLHLFQKGDQPTPIAIATQDEGVPN